MESLSERIKAFLDPYFGDGSGDGSGYGDDYGSGDGSGDGSGFGNDSGHGYGGGSGFGNDSGYGSGDGSGYGDVYGHGYGCGDGGDDGNGYGFSCGLKSYCGEPVYMIDGVQTIVYAVRGNIAKGEVVNSDLTTTPCFIVKQDRYFAHGATLAEAMSALRDKLFEDMSEGERIAAFVDEHQLGVPYPCRDLYDWHQRLTGSCDMGRAQFVQYHGIDIDTETRTVEEFIELTRDAYGGKVIRHLEAVYKRMKSRKEEHE